MTELAPNVAVRPGDDDTARLTVPENPATLVTVMTAVPCTPAWVLRETGCPSTRKSTTLTEMTTERERDPEEPVEVPVIVNVKTPATAEVTVIVEVPVPPELRATLVGFGLAAEFVDVRVTTPLKPFALDRVTEVVLDEPA